jgi:hypothetical protein
MATTLNSLGKSALFVHRLTQKLSFLKRVDQLAKQSAFVSPAKFVQNVWNMRSRTMSVLEFGAAYPSANAVA